MPYLPQPTKEKKEKPKRITDRSSTVRYVANTSTNRKKRPDAFKCAPPGSASKEKSHLWWPIKPKSTCPTKVDFTIGQMRVPFTIDAHRSPHQQYFANRSFIAKQVGNVRDVGATLGYKIGGPLPLTLQAGMFNGSGLTDQKDFWTNNINYSAKAQWQLPKGFSVTLSAQKIRPEHISVNMYDGGITYQAGRWMIEAEYLYKHYTKDAFQDVNAFDGFICYDLPLKKVFSKISFLGRFDYMGDHSDGTANENGHLTLTDAERKRITGGITLSIAKPFISDIRINYEKYFYNEGATPKVSEQDKFVIEFMTRF